MINLITRLCFFAFALMGPVYSAEVIFYICKGDRISLRFAYPKLGIRVNNMFVLEVGEQEVSFLDTEKVRLYPSFHNKQAHMTVEASELSNKIEKKATVHVVLPDENENPSTNGDIDFNLPFTTTIKMTTKNINLDTKTTVKTKVECEIFGLGPNSSVLQSIDDNVISFF